MPPSLPGNSLLLKQNPDRLRRDGLFLPGIAAEILIYTLYLPGAFEKQAHGPFVSGTASV
jgi:hypothetical protein